MPKASTIQIKAATDWMVTASKELFNPIKRWIDDAQEMSPLHPGQGSYFQELWETIQLYDHDTPMEHLYRSYMKKNLMGIIRAHYYKGTYADTTGIVILQGGENSYKSTWVNQLLPPELKEYIFPSQAELSKNAKEVSMEAGVCQIWLKDEVEAFISGSKFMKNADGALKSFLVQSTDAYRPLFASTPVQVKRKCIFFGTTNEPELELSGTGNRRIQIIPVKKCDTTAQAKLSMVRVYQELLNEFLETKPHQRPNLWILSAEERTLNDEIIVSERKLTSGGDINILEVFDFEAPYDETAHLNASGTVDKNQLWKIKDIVKLIHERTGDKPNSAALKHTLKRVVGNWTSTVKEFASTGSWSIEYGQAKYRHGGRVKFSGYIMPPVIDTTRDIKASNDLD